MCLFCLYEGWLMPQECPVLESNNCSLCVLPNDILCAQGNVRLSKASESLEAHAFPQSATRVSGLFAQIGREL
jgi:hypothetical protein